MSRTRRHEPRNGEFKRLRGNKKQQKKERRNAKAKLQKEIGLSSNAWDNEPNAENT